MKIVIEYVLIENFLINLMILKSVSLILKEKGRLFFLSAFLGACCTVVIPILYLSAIGSFLLQIGLVVFYVCISFKFKTLKKFMQIYLTYFVTTLLYGGACFYIESLFGLKSTILVLVIVVSMFFIVKFLTKKINRKKAVENFCFDVEIDDGGKKSQWKGFLDSGNLLFDPLTENPVCLINYKVFSSLFKEIQLEDILRKSDKVKSLKLAHYISFNTLNNTDKILVFQVDELKIGNRLVKQATLGLCLKSFNQAFGSDIILHNNFACANS